MDFPKSVPGVGLVNGKFIDEDPLAARPGSLIPSAWGNAVTQEILNVISSTGVQPDEGAFDQLLVAINKKVGDSTVQFASQLEAEAGTNTAKAMSPARVFQAIAKVVTQATEAAFGWLKIATQVQVAAGSSDATAVTPLKLAASLRVQSSMAFTTGGVSSALTLTPVPAATTYTANQRYRIKFSLSSTGVDTLNVSGLGTALIRQYDASGARVPATFVAGYIADVEYDGVYFIIMNPMPSPQVPAGASVGFYLTTAPAGYLKENGAAVSRTTYAALFAVIGTAFGSGDGSTTFNLPDHRAEFPRGADDSRGIDVGRTVGSTQAQSIQAHSHTIQNKAANFSFTANTGGNAPGAAVTGATDNTGGTETRPRNIAKLYCIKY